jgi:hypothetical protein
MAENLARAVRCTPAAGITLDRMVVSLELRNTHVA